MLNRREFVAAVGGVAALGLIACAAVNTGAQPRVVVVGGGYGGATAAKYLRLWSEGKIEVVLIEPEAAFVSCPLSNLVLGGSQTLADLTTPYTQLALKHGVKIVRDTATRIDPAKREVTLAAGGVLGYDRLILSPGSELIYTSIEGLAAARERGEILQAWKAGPETVALRKQLEAMPDGGVFAITIPEAPYRCPPGPYERACQVASYFAQAKPKSKVLILDANQDVVSKGPLFKKVWAEQYKGMVEYRPQHKAVAVSGKTIKFDVQPDVSADVLNVLPDMRGGRIAFDTGVLNMNQRWAAVDYLSFESLVHKNIHVIGDSIQIAPLMPKSGHMANQHAKVAAAAIVSLFNGQPVNDAPMINNTCYSFVDAKNVIHVASVHKYDAEKKTFVSLQQSQGAGGVSAAPSELEGRYAFSWAKNIWADALA
jgi:NADPH-dependent 2,4-dienoyl-CoA reductase/sulfur reductase-like enzyme